MTSQPAWLTPEEMRAWRNLIELAEELRAELEPPMQRGHGLTNGDYQVLVLLSEAPHHELRMCDLATRLRLSPSGLTRRLDGLVRADLVERRPATSDRRVVMAALTQAGDDRLHAAAPDHVDAVRAAFVDHLRAGEAAELGDLLGRIRERRAAAGTTSAS